MACKNKTASLRALGYKKLLKISLRRPDFFHFQKTNSNLFYDPMVVTSVETILSQRLLWRPVVYCTIPLIELCLLFPLEWGQETLICSTELFYRYLSKPHLKADMWVPMLKKSYFELSASITVGQVGTNNRVHNCNHGSHKFYS